MIELSAVAKRYGALAALDGVDLTVDAGEFVALVGGSGSGKTTLLKTINGLIRPDSGRIVVAGEDVAAAEPHALRRRIGYVFQEVGLFPHLTVAENIAITPKLLGWDEARRAARVAELAGPGRPAARGRRPRRPPPSPAASASGSASPAPSPPSPG